MDDAARSAGVTMGIEMSACGGTGANSCCESLIPCVGFFFALHCFVLIFDCALPLFLLLLLLMLLVLVLVLVVRGRKRVCPPLVLE